MEVLVIGRIIVMRSVGVVVMKSKYSCHVKSQAGRVPSPPRWSSCSPRGVHVLATVTFRALVGVVATRLEDNFSRVSFALSQPLHLVIIDLRASGYFDRTLERCAYKTVNVLGGPSRHDFLQEG